MTEISVDPMPDPDEVVEWRFVPVAELDAWIARARDGGVHRVVPAGVGDRQRSNSVSARLTPSGARPLAVIIVSSPRS